MLSLRPAGLVQRPEATGRAGPRVGAQPAGAASRRTAEPPRRVRPPAGAARTEGAATRIRLHDDRRHARPGRGAVAGGSPRGDGCRCGAAIRHARTRCSTIRRTCSSPSSSANRRSTCCRGVARVTDGRVRVEIGSNAGGIWTRAVTDVADGTRVTVGIRPQDCALTADAGRAASPPPWPTSSICSSSGLRQAPSRAWRKASSCRLRRQESYEPEQRSWSRRRPNASTCSTAETGSGCDDQALQ